MTLNQIGGFAKGAVIEKKLINEVLNSRPRLQIERLFEQKNYE